MYFCWEITLHEMILHYSCKSSDDNKIDTVVENVSIVHTEFGFDYGDEDSGNNNGKMIDLVF